MRPGSMTRIGRLAVATIVMMAGHPRVGASRVMFLGDSATAQSSHLRLRWSDGVSSDSAEVAASMTPGTLYSNVSFDTSFARQGGYGSLRASYRLWLAPAGDADSTAPVAYCSIAASQSGGSDPSSRSALSRSVLSLHYSSQASTIYWGIKATIHQLPFFSGGSIREELIDP